MLRRGNMLTSRGDDQLYIETLLTCSLTLHSENVSSLYMLKIRL